MSDLNLTVNAVVAPSSSPNPVIYQYTNPEIILINMILEYFNKIGFNSLVPNFRGIRVGAEHPFIMFLYNEAQGQNYDFNMLPSVTITDQSGDETLDTLSMGYEPEVVDSSYITQIAGQIFNPSDNTGFLVTSSTNISALKTATASGQILSGTSRFMTQHHNVNLEIWAENKNITSLIYDAMNGFFLDYMDALHILGIDFVGISGRRSGDFNLDYGRLLWGSFIDFTCLIRIKVLEIDLETSILQSIVTKPTFEVAK